MRSKCLRFGCSDRRSGTKQSSSVETEERESRRKNLRRSSRKRLLPSSALFQIDNSLLLQPFAPFFSQRDEWTALHRNSAKRARTLKSEKLAVPGREFSTN